MTLAIVLFAGTMGLVALFIESKMPELLADLIMEKIPNVQMAAVRSGLLFVGAVFLLPPPLKIRLKYIVKLI